jgi:uncharacterized protein (TIGR03066 family)
MRRSLAALVVVATAALVAPALGFADDKPLDGDAKKLQGKWTAKGPDGSPIVMVFDKDKVSIKLVAPTGEEMTIAGDYSVDEKPSPRGMMWTNVKVRDRELPEMAAIYAFTDDDTLKIAGVGGSTRPKEFIEKGKELPGTRSNTMVLTRVKDEAKK